MSTNGYPFTTRRQVLERIASDPTFVVECVAILEDRYQRRASGPGESMGWMASHAAKASGLAAKIAAGEATEKERAEAAKLALRYAKQLARVFRDRDLAARPELDAQAAVFGLAPPGSPVRTATDHPAATSPTAPGDACVAPVTPAVQAEAPSEPVPAPKRRGRPKGSKNRPKEHAAPPRRRRSRA